jgi:hypothetical protein
MVTYKMLFSSSLTNGKEITIQRNKLIAENQIGERHIPALPVEGDPFAALTYLTTTKNSQRFFNGRVFIFVMNLKLSGSVLQRSPPTGP